MKILLASQLLSTIYTRCHGVVVDENGEIFEEYKRFLRQDEFLAKWFISMSNKSGKFLSRARGHVDLDTAFDPDDLKFLEVAINSPHRIIVTVVQTSLQYEMMNRLETIGYRYLPWKKHSDNFHNAWTYDYSIFKASSVSTILILLSFLSNLRRSESVDTTILAPLDLAVWM